MDSREIYLMITRMEKYGGLFVSNLANALRYADPTNKERILNAFPEYIEEYGPGSKYFI